MISIIIPVYKAENTLRKCVESCLNQTYKDIEIILVDDGSPDSCPTICNEYSVKDGRVIVLHKKNGGVSSARNLGLKRARGEFIVFVDSDDWIEDDMLKHMMNIQIKNDYDLILCNYTIHFDNNKSIADNTYVPKMRSKHEIYNYLLMPNKEDSFRTPWAKMYKSRIIHENNLQFNESLTLGEDTCFNYQYISYINSIYCINGYNGYNFRRIFSSEKKARYYKSAKYLFNSRIIMIQEFTNIFSKNTVLTEYKDRLTLKYIYALSILENVAVSAGFNHRDIIQENIRISKLFEIRSAKLNDLSMRDKFTLICYRYKLYGVLYCAYKVYSICNGVLR